MAGRQKERLRPLATEEQAALVKVAKGSSERLDRVRRARALLAVAEGQTFTGAAERAGLRSHTAVAELVGRFNRRGLAALNIAAGRGRKPTYDTVARARIVATAQRPPERRLRRDALPRVGAMTLRRVLEAAGSSYQKTRTWCPTGTAQRKRKAGIVRVTDPRTEEKRG